MIKNVARLMLVGAAVAAGCAATPRTQAKKTTLQNDAVEARQVMLDKDPSLRSLIDQSAGYVVFPEVKEGGFVVGGAGAQGVVFERGRPFGYATLSRASVGALVGGQKYAELVAVRDHFTLDKMRAGDLDLGAQASAVILHAGAATATRFGAKGVAVVIDPIGGAMVNASINGQRIKATM